MEDSIVISQSIKVFVRLGGGKEKRARKLVGMLKEYKEKFTSVQLQKEAMKWLRQNI